MMENEPKLIEIAFNPIPGGFVVDVYDGLIGNHVRHVADLTDKAIQKGLETLGWMHWLPISEDAVFDRSESMLFRLAKYDTTDASGIYHGTYLDMVETYRPFITHYARITEPK